MRAGILAHIEPGWLLGSFEGYVKNILGLYWEYLGAILGLYWGYMGVM